MSGLSLLSSNMLMILAYITENKTMNDHQSGPARREARGSIASNVEDFSSGKLSRRHNAHKPELRLIDLSLPDEEALVSADALSLSRFQILSPGDYHMGAVPGVPERSAEPGSRRRLEGGGDGFWSARLKATRILSSTISVRSSDSTSEATTAGTGAARPSSVVPSIESQEGQSRNSILSAVVGPGLKVYVQSPYDCILARRRDLHDHFEWLLEQHEFRQAWELLDSHPEIISRTRSASGTGTPTKGDQVSNGHPLEVGSIITAPAEQIIHSALEKEKRRVGEEWIKQLISSGDWTTAAAVCGKVLGTSARWEHWVWVFAQANKFEEITPFIPTTQLRPPLPSLVYEYVLGHFISKDRVRLRELLNIWPAELFDIKTITDAIEAKLKSGEVRADTVEGGERGRDWRILVEELARLLVADSRPREALKYYMTLKDADAVMGLIREFNLLDELSDDLPGLILLRVSDAQLRTASIQELEQATAEAVALLVEEAVHGLVGPATVVSQLEKRGLQLFLFFYLRALWNLEATTDRRIRGATFQAGGKSLVDDFGDVALELFAEYDRSLLLQFLKTSQSYTFEKVGLVP